MFCKKIKRCVILLFSLVTVAVFSMRVCVSALPTKNSVNPDPKNIIRVRMIVNTEISAKQAQSMYPIFEIYSKLRRELRYDRETGERLRKETKGMNLKERFMRDVAETRISGKGNCRTISHRVLQELYEKGIECYSVIVCMDEDNSHAVVMCIWNGEKYIIDLSEDFDDFFVRIFTLKMYLNYLKIKSVSIMSWFVIHERLDTFDKDFESARLVHLSPVDGTEIPLTSTRDETPEEKISETDTCREDDETSDLSLPKKRRKVL